MDTIANMVASDSKDAARSGMEVLNLASSATRDLRALWHTLLFARSQSLLAESH